MNKFYQQFKKVSGCSGCIAGGCNRQISCYTAGCMRKCGAVTVRIDAGTRFQNLEKEIELLKCNRRCQQGSCRLSGGCLQSKKEITIEG